MLVKVNNEDYDVVLLETEAGLIILVDDEPFSIGLANETHDALGRFASTAGSAIKSVAKKTTKGVVGSAVIGGVLGGIGGALKEGITGDVEQGGALKRAKAGLIRGVIRGAKKGAMRKLVKNTLDIGAEHAGGYGWAVRSLGGISIAIAGKKRGFGLEPGDFNAIGKEMLAQGFSEVVAKTLEYETVYLQEADFKQGIGQLAMMIADFLENSEEDYMGVEDGAGLEELGFVEKEGIWYIHREDAIELLASLLAYGETKLEAYESETVKLFNPYHDSLGRFATAKGIASAANVIGKVAGISGNIASGVVNSEANKRYRERYGSASFSDWWSGEKGKRIKAIKEDMTDEKVFTQKIGDRELSITYGQLSSYGRKARFVAVGASMLSFGTSAYVNREAFRQAWEQAKQRADSSYQAQGKKTYSWPKGATDEDFQKMYRKVAKKYHPDLGGDTDTMQRINRAYANKDWKFINDLFIKLEVTDTFGSGLVELLCEVLEEFLESNAELLTFPDDGTDDFVVDEESGLAVIDRITAQFLYDVLEAAKGEEENGEPSDTERETETD